MTVEASPCAIAAASTTSAGGVPRQNASAASVSPNPLAAVQPPIEVASRSRIFSWVALSSMMTTGSDDTSDPRVATLSAILGKLHQTQHLGVLRGQKTRQLQALVASVQIARSHGSLLKAER